MSTQAIDPPAEALTDDHLVHEVVGPPLTPKEAGAAVALGVVALVLAGVMPLLLGSMGANHRIAVSQIGDTAMAEALTMGASTALCGALLRPRHLRLIGFVSVLLLAAINLAMIFASGVAVIGLRGLAGVAEGVLVWIVVGMIARSTTPERWAGVYYMVLTACQLVITGVINWVVAPHWGANGGFVLGAVAIAASAPIAFLGRNRYSALPDGGSVAGSPPPRGWVALAAMFLYAAAFGAVAIYTVPIARQAGLSANIAGMALTASLAAQILGSGLATMLAGRLHHFAVLVVCILATMAGWAVFVFWPPAWLFVSAAVLVGFVYMIATPFLVPMVIEADPTRRAAVQGGGAQLFGAAFGPFLAARVVGDHDVHGAVALGVGLLIAGLAIVGGLHLTARIAIGRARA